VADSPNLSAPTAPDAGGLKTPTILVTGDVVVDHHLYIGTQRTPNLAGKAKRPTFEHVEFGGAAMIERLLRGGPGGSGPAWNVHFGQVKDHGCYLHCFATWTPWRPEKAEKEDPYLWLASEQGYGPAFPIVPGDDIGAKPSTAGETRPAKAANCNDARCPARDPSEHGLAGILVLDDSGAGFRHSPAAWPQCLDKGGSAPKYVVWKMSGELDGGALWTQVKEAIDVKNCLVLLVSAADLQRAGLDVTTELSWERSALDVLRGLMDTTHEPLKSCAHLVVSFPDAGALWISRVTGAKTKPFARLVYDPSGKAGIEIVPNRPKAFGYQACLTAGVVWSVAQALEADMSDPKLELTSGLRRGLSARRLLYSNGHGKVGAAQPAGFPAAALRDSALIPDPDPTTPFSDTEIPMEAGPEWTIVQQGIAAPGAFYDTACSVALKGLETQRAVPWLKVGDYTTIERSEIEAFRRLQRKVDEYISHSPQKRPLSLAVFGAPGAGKSFIVEEMAKGLLGKDPPFIVCNLSQLSDERDLQGAFHLVRDMVLAGTTPIVFWDEFDSQEYRWLRLLLAPMQDGEFREGQIIHPIGKCIFIFAGGTSATFEEFGKPDSGADPPEAARQLRAWRMCKGPDFRSRIHGHLDVLGPNPRLLDNDAPEPVADPTDPCFPIRRALFMRGRLGLYKEGVAAECNVRLVEGLLRVPLYRHGSRSFDRLLCNLRDRGLPIEPQSLPSAEELAVDIRSPEKVLELVEYAHGGDHLAGVELKLRNDMEERLDEFAAYINRAYMDHPEDKRSAEVTLAYDNLSLFLRESNRAAVRRIPGVLAAAGLAIVEGNLAEAPSKDEALALLEEHLEAAAIREHEGWCLFHSERGWVRSPRGEKKKNTSSVPPRHPALTPWDKLSEDYRKMDRDQAKIYVKIVYDLGFAVVRAPGQPTK
jgi:hypothetical protein